MINSVSNQNFVAIELAALLQANNEAAESDCAYLESAVNSWLRMAIVDGVSPAVGSQNETFTLWAQLLPARCDFQNAEGVITICNDALRNAANATCEVWDSRPDHASIAPRREFASLLDIRVGGIREVIKKDQVGIYNVTVLYNMNPSVQLA
jgi:hypothetical protein